MKNELYKQIIALFLKINPDPTDEQFHALAYSLNIDHEALEAISYSMLADAEEEGEVSAGVGGGEGEEGLSDAQDVLDGEYDPATTKTDDLLLNDGLPATDNTTQRLQDSTFNDGVADGDNGAGIADQSMLYTDGLAPMKLGAARRLKLSEK